MRDLLSGSPVYCLYVVIQLDPEVNDIVLTEQAGTVLLFNVAKTVVTQLTIAVGILTSSAGGGETAVLSKISANTLQDLLLANP